MNANFLNLPDEMLAALERQEQGGRLSDDETAAIDRAVRERMMLARLWREHREAQGEVIEPEPPERPAGI
jgi:hypothetical protein